MKARELMIGDLVHLYVNNNGITDENVKVISLGEDWISIVDKFGLDEEYAEDDSIDGVSAITPIPLTEEILKANGFVANKGSWWLRSDLFTLNTFVKGGYCAAAFHEQVFINYVHELQHALRLCGLNDLADNVRQDD